MKNGAANQKLLLLESNGLSSQPHTRREWPRRKAGTLLIGWGANSYYVGAPRYKIGDLVRACFTYYEYYTFPYYEEDDDSEMKTNFISFGIVSDLFNHYYDF